MRWSQQNGDSSTPTIGLYAAREYPQCINRDLELLNHTAMDFIRPESEQIHREPPVSRYHRLRMRYMLAQEAEAIAEQQRHRELQLLPKKSQDEHREEQPASPSPPVSPVTDSLRASAKDGSSFPFATPAFAGANAPFSTSPASSLSASLAAAGNYHQNRVGGGAMAAAPFPIRTVASGRAPVVPRGTARKPSPFLKSISMPGVTMPVQIPHGHSPSSPHGPRSPLDPFEDTPSESPPSTSSSPDTSASQGSDALARSWSCKARPQAHRLGHRPRHSLSVSVVRARANSVSSSPITSGSYTSLNQSPAVSFLASLAESTVARGPARGEYQDGDQVGDYLLRHEIGVGAFSRVFEAEIIDGPHKQLERVAVKIVIKDEAHKDHSQDVRKLIDHETAIWARLRHPHVLEMLELMDTEDAVFVVSELVSGGNLLDYIRAQGRLPEPVARKLFQQIASGLRYLHTEIQVVHRDVKCENILLDANGNAKLADFGLAAEMSAVDSPKTFSGSPMLPELTGEGSDPVFLMGSIHYCSPEELRRTTACNPASDLWSLGVVLFAMLTGSLPFSDGYMPRLQMMIQNGRWDQAKLDAAGCSEHAKEVVRGLLKPKVEDRWTEGRLWAAPWLAFPSE
ncbi:hypothetical protein HKX48_009209 [Thoreauomyces humboldtii]|nr:hypothetical protein HKX48_009209 [Thoreauomyces humboldtii]